MNKINRLLVLALLGLLSACASTMQATMDHDSSFDFSTVRSVAILPVDRSVLPAPMVSDLQIARMNESFSTELMNRGYTVLQDPADADLLMTWHLVTQERTDVRTYNTMSARYRSCWSCPPGWGGTQQQVSVRQFTEGTLIVDLLDPSNMQSVWRSIVQERLRDLDGAEAAARRTEAAQAILAGFPPN